MSDRPGISGDLPPRPLPPPVPSAPAPPPAHPVEPGTGMRATGPRGANPALALVVAVAATSAGLIVMLISKDALAERSADDRHALVQVALFAVAGLGWALIQRPPLPAGQSARGSTRMVRALFGAIAGAGTGFVGTLLLGSIERHDEALEDAVLSGASLGRAALWAVVTASAWTITVAAGTVPARMPQAATGAALGGAATGGTMGLLAGTYVFGDSVLPTDLWLTFPFADTGEAMRSLPMLLLATIVPLVLAATSVRATRLAPAVAAGVAVCLALPALGGLAGYTTELDEARRDGVELDANAPGLPVPGAGNESADEPSGPEVDTSTPGPADDSDDASVDDETVQAEPAAEPGDEGRGESEPATTATTATTPQPPPPRSRPPRQPTVPSRVATNYPVYVTNRTLASNDARQQATTDFSFGKPSRPRRAPVQTGGGLTCAAGRNDAVIPFAIRTRGTTGDSSLDIELRFSQTQPGVADASRHPMSIEFNDRDGKRCTDATEPDPSSTAAVYLWRDLARGQDEFGNGYIIIANYWNDPGEPIGRRSAVLSITPVIESRPTSSSFTVYGAGVVRYRDPATGERVAAMRLVR